MKEGQSEDVSTPTGSGAVERIQLVLTEEEARQQAEENIKQGQFQRFGLTLWK